MDTTIKNTDLLKDAIAAELGSDVELDTTRFEPPLSYETKLITIDTHPLPSLEPSPSTDKFDGSGVVYTVDVTVIVVR